MIILAYILADREIYKNSFVFEITGVGDLFFAYTTYVILLLEVFFYRLALFGFLVSHTKHIFE